MSEKQLTDAEREAIEIDIAYQFEQKRLRLKQEYQAKQDELARNYHDDIAKAIQRYKDKQDAEVDNATR